MNFNIDKILLEWAYRVDDGQPDVTNSDHVNHLREILYHFGLPHKFIVEYVHGLTEDSIVKNKKSGSVYPVKKVNPATQQVIKKNASKKDLEKLDKNKDSGKETTAKGIEKQLSKDKYIKFGRLHKINILLYGVPGSGKTCLCKAIAKKYNRDVYIINFSKSLTDEVFIQLISSINKNAIILLEDIDSYFDKRNALDINVSFSCLINILDGTMSKGNGNILFITANNPENMDKALLRPGRIDKIYKFDYPDKEIIKYAFDDLVNNNYLDYFEIFYEKIKKLQLNMSSIIDYLFRNSNTFINNIDELSNQSKLRNDITISNINIYN